MPPLIEIIASRLFGVKQSAEPMLTYCHLPNTVIENDLENCIWRNSKWSFLSNFWQNSQILQKHDRLVRTLFIVG